MIPDTRFLHALRVQHPIIQEPMAGIAATSMLTGKPFNKLVKSEADMCSLSSDEAPAS